MQDCSYLFQTNRWRAPAAPFHLQDIFANPGGHNCLTFSYAFTTSARATIPISVFSSSTTGTRFILFCVKMSAISYTGIVEVTVMVGAVITSFTKEGIQRGVLRNADHIFCHYLSGFWAQEFFLRMPQRKGIYLFKIGRCDIHVGVHLFQCFVQVFFRYLFLQNHSLSFYLISPIKDILGE